MNQEIRNSPLSKKIIADIKSRHASGTLKDKHLKDFLANYYEGDPSIECPKGCKATCILDCYAEIHSFLINDKGQLEDFGVKYVRDGEPHCCGRQLEDLNSNLYCTVCGREHSR